MNKLHVTLFTAIALVALGVVGSRLAGKKTTESAPAEQASGVNASLEVPKALRASPSSLPSSQQSSSIASSATPLTSQVASRFPAAKVPQPSAAKSNLPSGTSASVSGSSGQSAGSTQGQSVPASGQSVPSGGLAALAGPPIGNTSGAATDEPGGSAVATPAPLSQPETQNAVAAGNSRESNLPVPEGAVIPAAFYDNEPRSPQQEAALNRILEDFDKNVTAPSPGLSEQETWAAAKKIADNQYLTLFGFNAYNERHLQAAKEALKEKQATQAP